MDSTKALADFDSFLNRTCYEYVQRHVKKSIIPGLRYNHDLKDIDHSDIKVTVSSIKIQRIFVDTDSNYNNDEELLRVQVKNDTDKDLIKSIDDNEKRTKVQCRLYWTSGFSSKSLFSSEKKFYLNELIPLPDIFNVQCGIDQLFICDQLWSVGSRITVPPRKTTELIAKVNYQALEANFTQQILLSGSVRIQIKNWLNHSETLNVPLHLLFSNTLLHQSLTLTETNIILTLEGTLRLRYGKELIGYFNDIET